MNQNKMKKHASLGIWREWMTWLLCSMALSLTACTSSEMLLNVPIRSNPATVDAYNISTFKEPIHLFDPIALEEKINKHKLLPRVENLFVIIDQSNSSSELYRGIDLNIYGKEIFRRFNRTIPKSNLKGGVFYFQGTAVNADLSVTRYDSTTIDHQLNTGKPLQRIGGAALSNAIDQVTEVMSMTPGRSGLVILTPWVHIDERTIESIDRLRQRQQHASGISVSTETRPWKGQATGGVCVFTVGIGNRFSRERFDKADTCGFSMTADQIAQPRDMAHFVERVLFDGETDSDGDGIPDYLDRCPDTAPDRLVTFDGCYRFPQNEAEMRPTAGISNQLKLERTLISTPFNEPAQVRQGSKP